MTLRFCALLLLLFACCSVEPLRARELSAREKEQLVQSIGKRLERHAYAFETDFTKWQSFADEIQAQILAAKDEEKLSEALQQALDRFGLSHLSIVSPEQKKRSQRGHRLGLGISFRKIDGGLFLTYVLEASPADQAGLKKGDVLTRIDADPITSPQQLLGKPGDRRQIAWLRGDREHTAPVTYASFPAAETSSLRWLTDDVALIKVQSFRHRYYKMGSINRFFREARQAEGIILDLRNNLGGLALFSRHLASKLVPTSEVFALQVDKRRAQQAGKSGPGSIESETLLAKAKKIHPLPFSRPYRGRVVIIVDSLSCSGGDLFPASMSELGRARAIGERTGGSLLLAKTFRLPHGFQLYAPVSEILTPKGVRLEKNGLKPDLEIDFRELADDDAVYRMALDYLKASQPQEASPLE